MPKVQYLAYREWAKDLVDRFDSYGPMGPIKDKFEDLSDDCDITFLIGWSDIIPEAFYMDRLVLVLHPSPLPKYRGGSPIQHQIINGETESAVTLFKLDHWYPDVDSGPIVSSLPYSLEGDLQDILDRISYRGSILVKRAYQDFEMGALKWTPQDEKQATVFKRRKPEESKLDIDDMDGPGLRLHNKIRALQDPYPNAFLEYPDGKLYITQTRWEPNE